MPYKVTIEHTWTTQGPFEPVWKLHYDTMEEAKAEGHDGRYGYATPPGERGFSHEETVYEQVRDDLDLAAVIRAVNEMKL